MDNMVSVIIPCFNAEHCIDRSIESVINQDWSAIELIVVNDGSTDRSAEHIHAWENKLHEESLGRRLVYAYQENSGPSGAINAGLQHVTGEYLLLLDADDRLLPESISERARYLDSHPECAIVRSNGYVVSGDNRWLFTYEDAEKKGDLFELLMRGKTYNWAGSYMLRTKMLFSFYRDKTIYPSRYGQNLQLLIPLSYRQQCGFLDKPLMEYIRSESSLSHESDMTKAKEKSVRNAEGYRDIRRHVIMSLPFDESEREKWYRIADGIYYRMILHIGIEHNDDEMIENAVSQMKRIKEYTMEDQIQYYTFRNRTISILLRAARRLRKHR